MPGPLDRLARSVLFRFDPETAHRIAIKGLALGLVPGAFNIEAMITLQPITCRVILMMIRLIQWL